MSPWTHADLRGGRARGARAARLMRADGLVGVHRLRIVRTTMRGGLELVLVGAIDDATGLVTAAVFRDQQDPRKSSLGDTLAVRPAGERAAQAG